MPLAQCVQCSAVFFHSRDQHRLTCSHRCAFFYRRAPRPETGDQKPEQGEEAFVSASRLPVKEQAHYIT